MRVSNGSSQKAVMAYEPSGWFRRWNMNSWDFGISSYMCVSFEVHAEDRSFSSIISRRAWSLFEPCSRFPNINLTFS